MKSLVQNETRREIHERIGRLRHDRAPLWGRMSAPQMVAHCADCLRMGLGELPTKSKRLPLRTRRLRWLGCASLALRLPRREPPPSITSGDYSRRERG